MGHLGLGGVRAGQLQEEDGTSVLVGGPATSTGVATLTFSGTSVLTGGAATSTGVATETFSGTSALTAGAATTTGVGATPPDTFAGTAAVLWLRWDLGTTVGGGTISAANDQSPAGHNVSQGTGSKQPSYTAADSNYNKRPTATFAAASSQELDTGTFTLAQPATIYLVWNHSDSSAGSPLDGASGTSAHTIAITASTSRRVWAGSFIVGSSTQSTPMVLAGVANGASSALYINNSQTAEVSGNAGVQSNTGGFAVGGSGITTAHINGTIAEVVVFPSAHDAATRAKWFAYFASMYGVAAA